MSSFSKRHLERARAGSFGSVAEQYNRFRPSYPDALIDSLLALQPKDVLDVGCGTGKAATALLKRGLDVLGVELDERMAEVAAREGVVVEVASFETWDDAGRQFDLIISGDAWHWINPDTGIRRAADLLRPGGTIARFWNVHELEEPVLAAFEDVYREHAPGTRVGGSVPRSTEGVADPFAGEEAFTAFDAQTHHWQLTLSADEWIGLVTTFSDHQQLESERRSALLAALHATIEEKFGGTVRTRSETFVQLARRVET
ncbi:class I SAM-dependent methyltransferase [Saccharopolyspora phatthalungensis]|uniref:SAM-dependent methyltransferase n=1 Tax=Saccharopolyspora phatthalungensis TaxID=664693 RepID=A0A840Q888_9PSEU|nr:class I SAM-dependent methyltransferase [Saccharopolyspora phatthalungensis]MBB5158732.1 SAM-dependent methyltransferase [Saccharopolyspora phatthalungensis]